MGVFSIWLKKTFGVPNSVVPDQAQCSEGPDRDPNFLHVSYQRYYKQKGTEVYIIYATTCYFNMTQISAKYFILSSFCLFFNTAYTLASIFGRHSASGSWKKITSEWMIVSLDKGERLKLDRNEAKIKTTFWNWLVKHLWRQYLKLM